MCVCVCVYIYIYIYLQTNYTLILLRLNTVCRCVMYIVLIIDEPRFAVLHNTWRIGGALIGRHLVGFGSVNFQTDWLTEVFSVNREHP